MARIQEILWELTMNCLGHPYYVGHRNLPHPWPPPPPRRGEVDQCEPKAVRAWPVRDVPGRAHTQSDSKRYLGSSLADMNAYDDLFLFRDPSHLWLLDSRARDALNTHDIRTQFRKPALAHETIVGRPDDHYKDRETTKWSVHAFLHADDPDVLPLKEATLDRLQFCGQRNYGDVLTPLKDTQTVDLTALNYARLGDTEAYILELVTP